MDPDLEARIRERAYALWVQDGHAHGKADDYWYRAEREIREEDGHADAEAGSVFAVPDSEMLSGEPDPGDAQGLPTVAALGTAPTGAAKSRRAAPKARPSGPKASGAPTEAALVETAAGDGAAKRAGKRAASPSPKRPAGPK
jgi:hypothetical protein